MDVVKDCTCDIKFWLGGKIQFYLSIFGFLIIGSLDGELMKQNLNFHLQIITQFTTEVVFVIFVF